MHAISRYKKLGIFSSLLPQVDLHWVHLGVFSC
uniref:Uncharacterized protein n=1 Tax=Rhizophora mucronata TaxID=61149 RepID=A0A2P2NSP8_RHIMU